MHIQFLTSHHKPIESIDHGTVLCHDNIEPATPPRTSSGHPKLMTDLTNFLTQFLQKKQEWLYNSIKYRTHIIHYHN